MGGLEGLVYRARPAEGSARGALVLLHGRGADENDLFGLLDALDPERSLAGFCPRGPLSLPPGGAHWYVVRRVGFPDPETFWPTFERAQGWLDALPEATGIPLERTVVGGFSQGAVLSYALSLTKGRQQPAALIALSGFIPEVEGLDYDLAARSSLPVAIGHGTYDPVIEVGFGRAAREWLQEAGFDVLYQESPMPHAVDPAFVDKLSSWLDEVLQPT